MSSFIKNALVPILEYKKSRVLSIIIILITVTILIAGLWPFKFNPVNKVERVRAEDGIRFYGQGIVFSPDPLLIHHMVSENASLTIELLVRANTEINNMVATILTLYDGNRDQVIFGQWKKWLIIRIPAARTGCQKQYREIGVENILNKDATHLITVISNQETTTIYIDGMLTKRSRLFSLIPKDQQLSGHLVLGNSPEGTRPWNGTILGIAIYERTLKGEEIFANNHAWQQGGQPLTSDVDDGLQDEKLTDLRAAKPIALYLFNEHEGEKIRDRAAHNDLLIPAAFRPLRRTILGMPEKDQWFSRANLQDVAINLIGFIPLGFFLSAWLRQMKSLATRRVYYISLAVGFCFSLAIELTQVYLPTRDSSLMDVISNTVGTAFGAYFFKYCLSIFHKVKSSDVLRF